MVDTAELSEDSGYEMGEPQLSEYEKQRLERIARNKEYLKSIGLEPIATPKPKPKKKKRPTIVDLTPSRKSKRLQKDNESLVKLSYENDDDTKCVSQDIGHDFAEEQEAEKPRQYEHRKAVSVNLEEWQLSKEQNESLKQSFRESVGDHYLLKMKEFLLKHDNKRGISKENARRVINTIKKLARGEGIRYESKQYGWPTGCYFQKGNPITPLSDIPALMVEAQECENEWGRDRGNGWLLKHPLMKLLLFQQFVLTYPEFLKAECQLSKEEQEL